MVYLGPSKGCETCKRRRKKCDENRPSCLRCQKSKRTCSGYEHNSCDVEIRQYHNTKQPQVDESNDRTAQYMQKSLARKCSLPAREPLPGTCTLPPDIRPKEVNAEQVDEFAIGAFFYNYCIPSSYRNSFSPVFLSNLEQSFHDGKPHSMLKKACRAVAYASHGIKLNRPTLTHRGVELYQQVLRWFASVMKDPGSTKSHECLVVAMLLGLYEMIVSKEVHAGYKNAHADGIAAMLGITKSPLHLLEANRRGHPVLLGTGSGTGKTSFTTLSNLLASLGVLYQRGKAVFQGSNSVPLDVIFQIRNEALALDTAFVAWEESQEKDFYPSTLFHIEKNQNIKAPCPVGLWPGRVDSYFDHHVAGIWNLYRASRLSLLDLILRLSDVLNDGRTLEGEHLVADLFVERLLSSIAFHLTENLHEFSRDVANNVHAINNPGRSIGGLLLMHSILLTSQLAIVDVDVREYLRRCLRWIGEHMGIGQAFAFGQSETVDLECFAGSAMIVLVGLMV